MGLTRIKTLAVLGCVALALAGCTGDGDAGPGSTGEPQTASSPSPDTASPNATPSDAADAAVRVTRQVLGFDVEVTVHPVQADDEKALVTIDYSVAPADAAAFAQRVNSIGMLLDGGATGHLNRAQGIRLVDAQAATVLPVAAASDGTPASAYEQEPGLDQIRGTSTSVHAAPSGDSVSVLLPSLGYVTNVPVVRDGAGFDEAVAKVADVSDPASYELRTFSASYDDSSSVQAQGETVTVTLTADVLFASSSAELSAEAQQAVGAAVEQIKASADGGAVTVIGHTDDVDSDEFNQTLSEQRAAAVATVLEAGLGGDYSVKSEGRGESEPVAAGTSPEARAANRRVEITFTGTVTPPEASGESKIPDADVPTAAAGEPVELAGGNGDTYSVRAEEFERVDGQIFGMLTVDLVSGKGSSNMTGALLPGGDADRISADRGFDAVRQVVSMHGFSLLTEQGHMFPFDYEAVASDGAPLRRLLGDEFLAWSPMATGETMLATAVWPDTGEDTVTLELPGKFRITDIPVVEAP